MSEHHSGLSTVDVWDALVALVEVWERADCDCCSPTPLDEALGDMDSVPGLAERVRRVGIDMATAGQWGVDRLAEEAESSAALNQPAGDAGEHGRERS